MNDRLLIGTYTNKQRGGIYFTEFSADGKINILQHVNDADNPSYLAVHPSKKIIVAVNEGAAADAAVSSYALNDDKLTLLNKVPSGGDHPCYVSIHHSGKWAAVANYSGGNMTVFPIDANGRLQNFVHEIHHSGSGTFLKRQEKPHAHASVFHKNRLYLTDLGLDKVYGYSFRAAESLPLKHSDEQITEIKKAGGPRHIAFHPQTDNLYVLEELSGSVSFFLKENNDYKFQQRIICSDDLISEDKGSADIHISSDGKFLYASNRAKANSLAIFKIESDGKLILIKHQSTEGEQPRNFVIHPSGKFLLIANQRTDNVVVFSRDIQTGLIAKIAEMKIPNPVCLKFI